MDENTKVLVAAIRNKIDIRYGCASCRCGTCGIKVDPETVENLKPMRQDEIGLLERMGLPTDGHIRLACQARIIKGEANVDLAFQLEYSPDDLEKENQPEAED